jgi:DnaJ-class molecular chaperone
MPFSEPRYVKCPDCGGYGAVEKFTWKEGVPVSQFQTCPLCDGSGKILDEQIPEEDE